MNRFPPRRILVAADLTAPSLAALDAAKALALRWGASLEVVHVLHPPVMAAAVGLDAIPAGVPVPPEPRRRTAEKLKAAIGDFPHERLKMRTIDGWPPAALLELAKPERADLLVMGTHGYSGVDRLLAGSVAEAVVRRARIPVLVVPEHKGAWEPKRVLAPWNGHHYSTRALRWAREWARGLDLPLEVLTVPEKEAATMAERVSRRRRLTAMLGVGRWAQRIRTGEARARIVTEANSGRYGLVVLSAHRRPFAGDLVLGSTAERLLRHGRTPVLAVPSGPARPRLTRRLASRAGARLY